MEDRRSVLRLTFADRLRYDRKTGLRTADLSLPFRALGQIFSGNLETAHPTGFEPVTSAFGVYRYSVFRRYATARPSAT